MWSLPVALSILCLALSGLALRLEKQSVHAKPSLSEASAHPITPYAKGLTTIVAVGTHYEVGKVIGNQSGALITDYMKATNFTTKLGSWLQSPGNIALFKQWTTLGQTQFPDAYEEIRGIADGSGIPLNDILLLNYAFDIDTITRTSSPRITHCTDVLINSQTHLALGHNEDGGPDVKPARIFIAATMMDSNGRIANRIEGYTYPGQLAGNAWAANAFGVAVTTNALFPKQYNTSGIPRCFLTRQILTSTNIFAAINMLQTLRPISGWSTNVLDMYKAAVVNIEISHNDTDVLTLDPMKTPYYFHMNEYRRLDVPQWPDTSSQARLAAAEQLPVPVDKNTTMAILGDTSNSSWPIYRNAAPPDHDDTLTTTYFDAYFPKDCNVWTSNPKSTVPALTYKWQ